MGNSSIQKSEFVLDCSGYTSLATQPGFLTTIFKIALTALIVGTGDALCPPTIYVASLLEMA
jgi:hypothetical protein